MEAVLVSIRPEWVERIASGVKDVELRKTRPRTNQPFKCYIYMTKRQWAFNLLRFMGLSGLLDRLSRAAGMVVGEFVCDEVVLLDMDSCGLGFWRDGQFLYTEETTGWKTCVDRATAIKYCGLRRPYGWHISALKIYDEPKPLKEFGCTRAPQSWGYIRQPGGGEVDETKTILRLIEIKRRKGGLR